MPAGRLRRWRKRRRLPSDLEKPVSGAQKGDPPGASLEGGAPAAERARNFIEKDRELDGLGREIITARGHGPIVVAFHGVRGERDHGDAACERVRFEPPRRLPAIEYWKIHVHEDKIRPVF